MQSNQQRRKLLIIAYLFPPIGGGGIQRPLKMAKYLGQFNWDVHVLTVEPTYHVSIDPSLLAQVPSDVTIHRCKEWNIWQLGQRLKVNPQTANEAKQEERAVSQQVNVKSRSKAYAATSSHQQARQSDHAVSAKPSLLSRIKRRVISFLKTVKNTVNIPDDHIFWYPKASRQAVRIINTYNIDAVMSTSGPYTNHLIGRYAKRKTDVTWIADFRDPWTQNMHRPAMRWRQSLERRMERQVVTQCDCLLTVTTSFANNFRHLYGDDIRQIEVIHNGFDQEDYEHLSKDTRHDERWRLAYTGVFYNERHPRLLLQVVSELIKEGKIGEDEILLQFAGVFDYPGNNENISCVRELNLASIVDIKGHLPHGEALDLLAQADALMLINDTHPDSGDYIPGKLYEYMAIGHPILALSLPGESTHMIETNGLGEIAHPQDPEAIKQALLKLYNEWKKPAEQQPTLARPPHVIPLIYERKEQARILAQLLDELTAKTYMYDSHGPGRNDHIHPQ